MSEVGLDPGSWERSARDGTLGSAARRGRQQDAVSAQWQPVLWTPGTSVRIGTQYDPLAQFETGPASGVAHLMPIEPNLTLSVVLRRKHQINPPLVIFGMVELYIRPSLFCTPNNQLVRALSAKEEICYLALRSAIVGRGSEVSQNASRVGGIQRGCLRHSSQRI